MEIREPWAAIAFPYATFVKMEEFRELQAGAESRRVITKGPDPPKGPEVLFREEGG